MTLAWIENKSAETEQVIHSSTFEGTSDHDVQQAIDACIEKACTLLHQNIQDDSRFLLFEWDTTNAILTIVVTDDSKQQDSRDVVKCHFTLLDQKTITESASQDKTQQPRVDELAENILYWIKDYLTTCAPFLRYSLIAAFHQGSRATCTLL
ncbi:hypothetical protein [Microbulbifer aggregans]|uniref:hypothetical protein n=1 Tax=Microbulbifer aggregans TaxID=1769779 RepID=UPI001CFDD032|nr:hypothetical protein [Microbulbifer aggregans]